MSPLLFVLIALVVSSLGMVAVSNWSSLSSVASGDGKDAQQVAEAGADQVIATFNQPENRRLLVADDAPPGTWSSSNTKLRSPCLSTTNTRPGGTGFPSSDAISIGQGGGDADFRNLADISQKNTGSRRFLLHAIRYSTGSPGSSDRRSIYRTYRAGSSTLANQSGSLPTGVAFSDAINLDDPDGGGPLRAGASTGFIAVTVEGRRYKPDGSFSSSIITKEYEVLPKCCGGSFGSNDSGGSQSGIAPAGSLGADSRLCGVDFGMVVGINGGRFFSQLANDRYTRRNDAGAVTNIKAIVAILAAANHPWSRASSIVNGVQVGCRTVPSPCNVFGDNNDRMPFDDTTIQDYYAAIQSATPGLCPSDQSGTATTRFGDQNSINGTAAGCIPFAPLYLSTGLPSIADRYTYAWSPGGNPAAVYALGVTSSAIGGYPAFVLNDTSASGPDGNVNIWLRANRSNQQASDTPGMSSAPYLEYCNTKYLPNNECASLYAPGGSTIHTWAVISNGGAVPGGIGDDFSSDTLAGRIAGSTPRWPSLWEERDTASGGAGLTSGDLQISGGEVIFQGEATGTNRPAIARAVNLYGIDRPVLEISFKATGLNNGNPTATSPSALSLWYSYDSAQKNTTNAALNTDSGWEYMATLTGDGGARDDKNPSFPSNAKVLPSEGVCANDPSNPGFRRCWIQLPAAATASTNRFAHWVRFRIRSGSTLSNNGTKQVRVTSVRIRSNVGTDAAPDVVAPRYLNWCEYSSTFPVTASFTGGFHCLGPSINLQASTPGSSVSRNRLRLDTTDESITFYYTSPNDRRGIELATPLINLRNGATLSNVNCPRSSPSTTAPVENCTTLVAENVFNPVGEYDRFNIFGRDTAPGNTCTEFNVANKPCMQIVAITANSSTAASVADRARLAGTWIYMPWGLVSFCVNGCLNIPALPLNELLNDDSWNYGGRVWVRSLYAGGQNHFRVPPSSSAALSALISSNNSAQANFVGWSGQDWVARGSSGARQGISLLN